jgi:secondary thiamine-phosphate synthase enzyme
MRQAMHRLTVATNGQGLVDITERVCHWVATQPIAVGLLTIWCRHTSASLLVQENADPDVRADLEAFLRYASAAADAALSVSGSKNAGIVW